MLPIIIPLSAAEECIKTLDITLAATDNVTGADNIDLDTDHPFLLLERHSVSSLETLTDELHKKHEVKFGLANGSKAQFAAEYIKSRVFSDARNSGHNNGPFVVYPAGTKLKFDVKNVGGANASVITITLKGLLLKDRNFWRQHGVTW